MSQLTDELNTNAEQSAEAAEQLPAFGGLKLSYVKKQLAAMLAQIGRDLIFSEFTKHDITHINQMLALCAWIIPDSTQAVLTPSDWLLLTLGIYFHDLGMLVTRQEFDRRGQSGYPAFKAGLLSGPKADDLRGQLATMTQDESERFLYQEFVRHTHATRIKTWIMGESDPANGMTVQAASEINTVLDALPVTFRRDLATICESHHLDDLDNYGKYPLSEPYGNTHAETANVQYAAIVLRTVDLMHITKDRTPSIEFRLIAPHNPVSHREWEKQMAVHAVRARIGRDENGTPSATAIKDTIEVHAYFTEPEPFFLLTSYLSYAREQLNKSAKWVADAQRVGAGGFSFPWKAIDDTKLETKGFLRQNYEFSLDQAKVLDLLTGHTIYDDAGVVIRELIQNALDAVRLQRVVADRNGDRYSGGIEVSWDSKERILCVSDDGTGMTRATIEQHLLKAGSSRYQDPDFRKDYPDFSPISRFGIGILSCFMVSDHVEIITSHDDETAAHQLVLRSVHGKYLVRTLEKREANQLGIAGHGTVVRLKLRHSANLRDPFVELQKWIVLPACNISYVEKGQPPRAAGFRTLSEALSEELRQTGILVDETVRIDELNAAGIDVAVALEWSEWFREWTLLPVRRSRDDDEHARLGVCIEGIRVEAGTPGYRAPVFYAIANTTGASAPKTNVARTGLESTPELQLLMANVYKLYAERISSEIATIQRERSTTWAGSEAVFLTRPLRANEARIAQNSSALRQVIRGIPMIVMEREGDRRLVPAEVLEAEDSFWTIDCAFVRSAESILRELSGQGSLRRLIGAADVTTFALPAGAVVSNYDRVSATDDDIILFGGREVSEICVDGPGRRIDLKWDRCGSPPSWASFPGGLDRSVINQALTRFARRAARLRYEVARRAIPIAGGKGETALRAFGVTYIRPGTKISEFLVAEIDRLAEDQSSRRVGQFAAILSVIDGMWGGKFPGVEGIRRFLMTNVPEFEEESREKVLATLAETEWSVFDTAFWSRRDPVWFDPFEI